MFMEDDNVIVCDNSNLQDAKFRVRDGLHLTAHGTAVLANNIKFKVAKALNIQVEKKHKNNSDGYRNGGMRNWYADRNTGYRNYFHDNCGSP